LFGGFRKHFQLGEDLNSVDQSSKSQKRLPKKLNKKYQLSVYLNKEQPAHIGIEMDSIVHVPLGVLLSIHGQKRGLHRGIGADLLG
jgi:hypothetical protein